MIWLKCFKRWFLCQIRHIRPWIRVFSLAGHDRGRQIYQCVLLRSFGFVWLHWWDLAQLYYCMPGGYWLLCRHGIDSKTLKAICDASNCFDIISSNFWKMCRSKNNHSTVNRPWQFFSSFEIIDLLPVFEKNPRHPNTSWEGIWIPKTYLKHQTSGGEVWLDV